MMRSLRMLLVTTIALMLQACGVNLMYSENFSVLKQDIDYRAPTPIAQRLEYVYATGTIIDDDPQLLLSTNLTDASELARRGVGGFSNMTGLETAEASGAAILTTSRPLTNTASTTSDSGTAQIQQASDQLSEQASAERAAGNTGRAEALQSNAIVSAQMAQVNQSFNDSINMMNAYAGTMNALSNLGKAFHEGDGKYLASWVSSHTNAIGDTAPEGTVLHMDFLHALKGESFNFSSDGDLIVTAVLEYPDGQTYKAARGIKIVVDSKSDVVPPGFVSSKVLTYTKEEAREIDSGDFNIPSYLHQFAVLIRSVVKDLYEQTH